MGAPFCVAVALELLQSVLAFGLLAFYDDVRRVGSISFDYHDIGTLWVDSRSEVDLLFDSQAILRVSVVIDQFLKVKLPHDLLRLGGAVLLRCPTAQVGLAALVKEL